MRCTPLLPVVAAIAGLGVFALARTTIAQPAATQPSASAPTNSTVLVLPFEALDGGGDQGKSAIANVIQRSLALDLSRSRLFHARSTTEVAATADAALRVAKDAGAGYAVWGTVQFAEGRIRVTGDVLDAGRDESVGAIKLTGTLREIFELQDQLAEQVRARLARAIPAEARNSRDAPVGAPAAASGPAEAPAGQPLRRIRPRPFDPDWLTPPEDEDDRYGDLSWRSRYAAPPYWSIPYGYGNGYAHGGCYPFGYAYGGYHYSLYRPWRPLYQHRYFDYTYRGLPDRRTWYGFGPRSIRSFNGPVPLRWVQVR